MTARPIFFAANANIAKALIQIPRNPRTLAPYKLPASTDESHLINLSRLAASIGRPQRPKAARAPGLFTRSLCRGAKRSWHRRPVRAPSPTRDAPAPSPRLSRSGGGGYDGGGGESMREWEWRESGERASAPTEHSRASPATACIGGLYPPTGFGAHVAARERKQSPEKKKKKKKRKKRSDEGRFSPAWSGART